MATLRSKVGLSPDVLFQDLAGEVVLLNLKTGRYYGLDTVGTRMWSLLARHGDVAAAYQSLLVEFDVDADRLQTDLLHFIDELASRQLLEVDAS